ncbi:GumC family protein [Oceanibium sediminis]|uniref:GumC family protein n=1 Tax=Oceanibium sediminis TaxID=2026339 RepID=UPI001300AB4A|nr:exopolysaccharide transport family protein [Oceanibium sediminis]
MLIQKGMEETGRRPPGPADEGEYLTIGDVARFVLRNLLLIILCTILFGGLALYYARSSPEQFTARATILIDRDQTQIAAVSSNTITLATAPVDDDLQLILSDEVLLPVVERLDLLSDPDFDPQRSLTSRIKALVLSRPPMQALNPEQDMNVTMAILRGKLTVRRVGQSNVLHVFTRSQDPVKSADITNAVANSFIEQEMEAKATAARRGSAWLSNRLEEVRVIANRAAINLADFKSRNELVDFGDGRFLNEQQLVQINDQLMGARATLRGLDARLSTLESALNNGLDPNRLPEIPNNPLVLNLRQQIVAQQALLRDLSSRFGEDAVVTRSATQELDALFQQLRGEVERSSQTLRAEYDAAKITEESLAAELERIIREQRDKRDARVEFQELESQSRAYRVMYETLLQQYMRSVQLESFPVTDARIVSRASVPLSKSHPRTSLIVLGGMTFGVLLGLAGGLIRLLFKQRIERPSQVARKTGLPCMGQIPRRRVMGFKTRKTLQLGDDRNSKYALALRELWSSLKATVQQSLPKGRNQPLVLGFTAFDLGDAANTVTADLCQVVAARGDRVLYISARPVEPIPGLDFEQEYDWVEDLNFDAATLPAGSGEVVVVAPAQSQAPAATRGLTSLSRIAELERLILHGRQEFSTIIVDLPQIGAAPELRELQQLLDGLFVIVRYGKTDMADLVAAAESTEPGAPVLSGYVIAQARRARRG